MTQQNRLEHGGRIDRGRPLTFTFNGRRYQGYHGDTLASALLANGVSVVARSFKYHRPRGIVGAGPEEPNTILQVGRGATTRPDQRATQVELYDGLEAYSVNGRPSLDFDLMGVNNVLSRLLPVGFYYKTFMWPARLWPRYEEHIRNAAGLGLSPTEPDPARYDKMNTHCDVLVVGGGPAGLSAALAAGRSGARVLLVDEGNELGGSLLGLHDTIGFRPASQWLSETVAELVTMPEVRVMTRTTAFGYYDHNFLGMIERRTDHLGEQVNGEVRERLWRVRAKDVVLATGAIERPLVFANNDRPGVMIASAVSTYVNRYGVVPGRRVVVFTNNDSAYRTVLDLLDTREVAMAAVVDVRGHPAGKLVERVRAKGVPVHGGHVVADTRGRKRVAAVEVRPLVDGGLGRERRLIECDVVAVSGGWSPVVHLHCHTGGRPVWDEAKACFVPGAPRNGERSAGAVTGALGLRECLAEGARAGADAAATAGFEPGELPEVPSPADTREEALQPLWRVPTERPVSRAPKQFVDFQNDTCAADIVLAAREGYESIEHVKRYTALGFGTDQGKLGNINGMGILAETLGQDIPAIGTTTFRPAYTPVTFGAVAGRDVGDLLDPVRKTAMHEWHVANGALFENVGQWHRPWYYPRAGETMQQSLDRECLAVRHHVGVLDASTLGKIDVRGPDANVFLDLIYTGGRRKMQSGQCRYGLMLHEDGMIFDDGVTAKLGDNHYLLTTTTGGAAGVLRWMEQWLQTEWPGMDVYLTSVTDQWATIAVNGPDSRNVLSAICDDVDFSRDAFPFMTFREGTVAGVAARVFRISFTGELAFEINVQANHGRHVWDAVMAAGEPYGITPYGTETMHILRAEKGFVIAGQDTDGSLTPLDMGMRWAIGKKKQDFLGKRSLDRSDMFLPDRKQFVGLLTEDPRSVLPEGAQLVDDADVPVPVPMVGHVSSSYYSAALGRSIALGVVRGGDRRKGETVYSPQPDGRVIAAEITDTVFYDPEGARQNV
ncbi:sarcosine oxidase subunit alpha family protein [Arhodomonas aquaeolei]|uniref:sarcosine oxidase subunit alpha family protein n=1 Tax=Arhodomonas aquaeolei TaxID=2369 RepID=UPI00216766B0|nr:sarcosine oxidase subunit alpha family protein [Arhodomonas aquaeolei]MCS4503372.1 sarcosine oxidase subunit alpha family protein [Arhodomonas aquaeolei]